MRKHLLEVTVLRKVATPGRAFLLCLCLASSAAPQKSNPRAENPGGKAPSKVGLAGDRSDHQSTTLDATKLVGLIGGGSQGAEVRIANAVVLGNLSVEGIEVAKGVRLEGCRFKGEVNLRGNVFKAGLELKDCIFERRFSLGSTELRGDLDILSCEFITDAEFASVRAANVDLTNRKEASDPTRTTVFKEEADFTGAQISGEFNASGTQFLGGFDGAFLRVGQDALFRGTHFEGLVDLSAAQVDKLVIGGDSTRFGGTTDLVFLRAGTVILDVTYSSPSDWFSEKPNITGMKCDQILGLSYKPKRQVKMGAGLELLAAADYSPDEYSQFEGLLRAQGYPDLADKVYIEGHSRGGQSMNKFSLRWLTEGAVWLLVGYGKKPWLTLIYSAVVVLVGTWFFRKQGMQERYPAPGANSQGGKPVPAFYSPFWYSVDLFTPVIDLKTADRWEPLPTRRFARNYRYVQRILGWILVPIFFGAWTGLIK